MVNLIGESVIKINLGGLPCLDELTHVYDIHIPFLFS